MNLRDTKAISLNWPDVNPFNVSASFVSLCLCAFVPLWLILDERSPQRHKGTK